MYRYLIVFSSPVCESIPNICFFSFVLGRQLCTLQACTAWQPQDLLLYFSHIRAALFNTYRFKNQEIMTRWHSSSCIGCCCCSSFSYNKFAALIWVLAAGRWVQMATSAEALNVILMSIVDCIIMVNMVLMCTKSLMRWISNVKIHRWDTTTISSFQTSIWIRWARCPCTSS